LEAQGVSRGLDWETFSELGVEDFQTNKKAFAPKLVTLGLLIDGPNSPCLLPGARDAENANVPF
jgi:hypothetical protein